MVETSKQVDVKREASGAPLAARGWEPFDSLRQDIDRLFDTHLFGGLGRSALRLPFARSSDFSIALAAEPAVDVVERDKAYELTAELPGLDRENIEIELANGTLTIRGEKKEEREEKAKNRYLSERRYGRFERMFRVPEGVDTAHIDASFNKGVLRVVLPKTAEAQRETRKIDVKER